METISSILTTTNTIDGTWVNNDKDTKSTTKIIITNRGKNVQVLGENDSKSCTWGTRSLTPETNSTNMYWAVFDTRNVKSIFIFTIDNNKMEVRYEQDYKSPSRETKRFVENFTRLNLHVCEPAVLSTPMETMELLTTKLGDLPEHNSNSKPIILSEDEVVCHDFNPLHYYLPSTYHLSYKEGISSSFQKWLLNVSTFISTIFNKVRNTVSIRRFISLPDVTT
ncbi:hypothetical protein [Flavivirga algicola]|uniref:Uncharacterized protein n=1 Tax=Flavivirga algicola TaxID=2729136 RepID=A0ABX1S0A0_9FLAO|nr:hypothetical protein [Flavivirga algicola]NMH88776.1 hypothetical protein [Flavivirga algicola]